MHPARPTYWQVDWATRIDLQEGQTVQFDVTKGPKGWQAENVTAV